MRSSGNSQPLSNRERTLLAAAALAVAASRWLFRARVPDDYDSWSFVLALRDYDLSQYQPQFPGYPVYWAAGKAVAALGPSALTALQIVNALSSGIACVALAIVARRLAGPRAMVSVIAFVLFAWLPSLLGSGALSETFALALAACAFACVAEDRSLAAGVLAGLLLGARISSWPLAVSLFALSGRRLRFASAAIAAVLAWAIPFVAALGPRELWRLGTTHLRGHFNQWGGSVGTRPEAWPRIEAFARGLLFDGLAPSPLALAIIGLCVAIAVIRARPLIDAKTFAIALAPYAVWVYFAQNLIEQPRHLLPLVAGLLVALACVFAQAAIWIGPVIACLLVVNLPLLAQRRASPPAPAQAAEWLAANGGADALVAAGRSARFFRALAPGVQVQEHAGLGDLVFTLARMDRFPARIFVTSEVALGGAGMLRGGWRAEPGPTFCRDARIDRARPCLQLTSLQWSHR